VEFGVVTQSAMAFSQLLGAFSLIVTQFQSISSFTAVIARLGSLGEAIEQAHAVTALAAGRCEHDELIVECPVCLVKQGRIEAPTITAQDEDDRVAYESLTLRSPNEDRLLLRELSVSIPSKTRVAVLGHNHPAKMALLRATAGIWETGSGHIVRPGANRILFLPERPYLLPGTLRQVLSPVRTGSPVSEDEMARLTRTFELDPVLARLGGLDVEADWSSALSLGEQQLLGVARLVLTGPSFVFLERPHTTLTPDEVTRVLDELTERGITYVTFTDRDGEPDHYDAVLELHPDASWEWHELGGAASPAREA